MSATRCRDGFLEISDGWSLVHDFGELTDRIEELAKWTKLNGPLNEAEEKTVELMIRIQIGWGFDQA